VVAAPAPLAVPLPPPGWFGVEPACRCLMHEDAGWAIATAVIVLIAGGGAGIRLVVNADPASRERAREAIAAVVQYGLLFGFAAVAAAVSARGLVGFARSNMGLPGLWPYLLWGALDGAAGLCAVLLMRRAARGESALTPRLAVWGLVTASSWFNWTHAPDHPGAREAFALMPVIAAMLFEFSLRETRHTASAAERRLAGLGWLRPAERIRVQVQLSAEEKLSAEAATRRVRVEHAARRLHALRQVLGAQEQAAGSSAIAACRVRQVERRAQSALSRARFTDPAVAAEVLRQVQVLTLTRALAQLDYATPGSAETLLAGLIAPATRDNAAFGELAGGGVPGFRGGPVPGNGAVNGHPVTPGLNSTPAVPTAWADHPRPGGIDPADFTYAALAPTALLAGPHPARPGPAGRDRTLIDVATRIVAQAGLQGDRLSQAALARQLRAEGYTIANDRLRWLATVSGLAPYAAQRQ
jgi:hypothetical protein